MKSLTNYSESNFFTDLDIHNGIMSFNEFIQILTTIKGDVHSRSKLAKLFTALGKFENYKIQSSVQVLIIYPNGREYVYNPPYFEKMPQLLKLTDRYYSVNLDLNKLLNMARNYYQNYNSSADKILLLNVTDDAKANLEIDAESTMVTLKELNGISHLMASSDRLRAMSNQINNQYNFEDDAY